MNIVGRDLNRSEIMRHVGRLSQLAGVRLVELADGPGRGTRILEFRSGGGLFFEVMVDRAFDLGAASIDGRPFNWTSPVGIQAPWYREPAGLGWLRGFGGGLMVTGGLDHTQFPEVDDASFLNFPAKSTEAYPLHGRISGEPAELAGYGERWEGGRCLLWAEGIVRQTSVFGENLELVRHIECELGSTQLSIHDTVTNRGFTPSPQMSLYHVNLGFPLIEAGARLVADIASARARGDFPMEGWETFGPPTADFIEEVVEIRPQATDGWAEAAIVNGSRDLLFHERFKVDSLPYLLLWRMFGEGTYVVGLEPSTNSTAGREAARRAGELGVLAPTESREFRLELGAAQGAESVATYLRRAEGRMTGSGMRPGEVK